MAAHLNLFRPHPDHDAFPRTIGYALLVIVGLYVVYDVGVFFALGSDTSVLYRVVLMLGMAAFPLPLLVAPAIYFAALDSFDLYGEAGPGARARHWRLLGVLALGAYLVVAVGPAVYDYGMEAVVGPIEALPETGMVADPRARIAVPFAVALFVVAGGVAGAMMGRITAGMTVARRNVARWTVCIGMLVSFMVTLAVVAELIKMHGILSPPWLALAPPAVPFALVCVLAHRDCARVAGSLLARLGRRRPTGTDALVDALRRTAAPRVAISEERVQAVVGTLAAAASPDPDPGPARPDGVGGPGNLRHRMEMAAGFAAAWSLVSVGFLFLGGAGLSPPTMVSGVAAGFLGAVVALSCHFRGRTPALTRIST